MMKKKRVLAAMIALLLMMTALIVSAENAAVTDPVQPGIDESDQTVEDPGSPSLPDENVPVTDETQQNDETANPTFAGRLIEWFEQYRQEFIDIVGFFGLVIAALISLFKQKKNGETMVEGVKAIAGNTSNVAISQNNVTSAVNEMIGAYNEMRTSYDKYEGAEDDRNKLVGAMVVQNAAILEILSVVYANSKNLPQGVKDLVNLKYAKCLATLEDDEKLRAYVAAVRDIVASDDASAAEGEATGTEEEG